MCWSSAEWTTLLSLWVKYWVIVCIRRLNNSEQKLNDILFFQFNFFNVIDTAPNKVMRDFTNNSQQCPIEIIISTKNVAIEGWRAVKFDKNIFCQFLLFNTWTIAQYLGNYHLTLLRGSYVCFSPILQKKKHLEARDFGTI